MTNTDFLPHVLSAFNRKNTINVVLVVTTV